MTSETDLARISRIGDSVFAVTITLLAIARLQGESEHAHDLDLALLLPRQTRSGEPLPRGLDRIELVALLRSPRAAIRDEFVDEHMATRRRCRARAMASRLDGGDCEGKANNVEAEHEAARGQSR